MELNIASAIDSDSIHYEDSSHSQVKQTEPINFEMQAESTEPIDFEMQTESTDSNTETESTIVDDTLQTVIDPSNAVIDPSLLEPFQLTSANSPGSSSQVNTPSVPSAVPGVMGDFESTTHSAKKRTRSRPGRVTIDDFDFDFSLSDSEDGDDEFPGFSRARKRMALGPMSPALTPVETWHCIQPSHRMPANEPTDVPESLEQPEHSSADTPVSEDLQVGTNTEPPAPADTPVSESLQVGTNTELPAPARALTPPPTSATIGIVGRLNTPA